MTTESTSSPAPHTADPTETAAWIHSLTVEDLATDTDAICARLRREAPLAFLPSINSWVATNWELCSQISDATNFIGGTSPIHERVFGTPHVIGAEGEEHLGLRGAIDPPLRPRSFRGRLEDSVRPVARERIEFLRQSNSAELMADYFEPISVRTVGDLLGFTAVSTDTLREWFHALSSGIANAGMDAEGNFLNPAGFERADAARAEIRSVVEDIAAQVIEAPDGSVVSNWLHGAKDDDSRNIEGFLPSIHVLLLGGLQEPGHACGSTFLGLTTRPEQIQRVVDDPTLIPRAITEGLRWISPLFTGTSRIAVESVELAGAPVEAGQTVWLSYGSANRDESKFKDPATYNLDRPIDRHLAFGHGRHACSGSAFAPQVARIALEELFQAFPGISLGEKTDPNVWGWFFRGPQQLHVTW
ncbi:cytochrome P450 [Rhodococcus ruber]|uniref:cytochrome P450 n=1 Tax=Rhodococcus ruber TaxID=1830 RepID=UPI00265E41EC|nr:cytochrome P450 [Rhodococcus ruber]MDO1481855.1 cytochrome P450 [Rhodococcus ruber]